MKKIIKNIIFYLLNFFYNQPNQRASILMYHSIGVSNEFFSVTKVNFEKQLTYMQKNNYKVIKLSDLVSRIKNKEDLTKIICLTIDDGYRDNYQVVFPLLKKYQIPATIFLITDFLGKQITTSQGLTFDLLTESEIKEMSVSGLVEFMPHTKTHAKLDQVDNVSLAKELAGSRKDLEDLLGQPADILAYPKGRYNAEIIDYLQKNNWQAAVTVEEGLVGLDSNLFKLKRNSIDSTTTFSQFKGKLSRTVEIYEKLKQ